MYEMQGPRSADLAQPAACPGEPGPLGQAAIRALVRPPPSRTSAADPVARSRGPAPGRYLKDLGVASKVPQAAASATAAGLSPPTIPEFALADSLDFSGRHRVTPRIPRFPSAFPERFPRLSELACQASGCPQGPRSRFQVVPVFAGREVLQPSLATAQEGSATSFKILLRSTNCPPKDCRCPQRDRVFPRHIHRNSSTGVHSRGRPRTSPGQRVRRPG